MQRKKKSTMVYHICESAELLVLHIIHAQGYGKLMHGGMWQSGGWRVVVQISNGGGVGNGTIGIRTKFGCGSGAMNEEKGETTMLVACWYDDK